ncbi:MAG: hypothetical protein AB7T06_36310 [Kofleriaceae bacterium]
MRTIWSALVVLVLLAPFGGVGITATPIDAQIVATPRGAATALAASRVEHELPPVVTTSPVVVDAPAVVARCARTSSAPVAILASEHHSSASPRDPPV